MKIRPLLAVCPTHYCDNVDDGKHEWLPLVEVLFATSASFPVSSTSQKLGLDSEEIVNDNSAFGIAIVLVMRTTTLYSSSSSVRQ